MSRPHPAAGRLSTRDLIGPTLVFIGAFLIAATIALPTLLVGGMRTVDLSTDVTTVATSVGDRSGPDAGRGPSAQILDRCSLNTPSARVVGASLVRQQRMVAVQPSDRHRVTLQVGTSTQADKLWTDGKETDADVARPGSDARSAPDQTACTDPTLSATRDRVTLDRTSATPALGATSGPAGNSEIQYDSDAAPVRAPDRRGYTYLLGFRVPKASAQFFDPTTRRVVPLAYRGQTQQTGRSAVRFTADVPDTDLSASRSGDPDGNPATKITRPASWFGIAGGDPARPVTATLHHRARWEMVADTATGVLLDKRLTVDDTYRFADPALASAQLTDLHATFGYDRHTRDAMAALADRRDTPVVIWGRVVPLVTGIVGLGAVGAGIYLIAPTWWRERLPGRRRRSADRPPSS